MNFFILIISFEIIYFHNILFGNLFFKIYVIELKKNVDLGLNEVNTCCTEVSEVAGDAGLWGSYLNWVRIIEE